MGSNPNSVSIASMESNPNSDESVSFQFLPYFRAYKDGRVDRFFNNDRVPPSSNSAAVSSKDVVISRENNVSARLFLPETAKIKPNQKLPLLIYFHGGAFLFGSPFCDTYHNYITSVVKEANVVAVSVDYRLAPEHLLPAAYEDAWDAIEWISSHGDGCGPEGWINEHADLQRVFIAGDSAGANISANTVAHAGKDSLSGVKIVGLCLIHPDFASREGKVYPSWTFACPSSTGGDDPRMNPAMDSRLSNLGCTKVVVFVGGDDPMKERGVYYHDTLKKSGWKGEVEILETPGEGHVFHLFNPTCENALTMLTKLALFINC